MYNIKTIQYNLIENLKKILKGDEISNSFEFGQKLFFINDPSYKIVVEIITSFKINNFPNNENHYSKISSQLSRAMACFICSGIGDSLGTHIECKPVNYMRKPLIIGFKEGEVYLNITRCNLGEFSDDTSMALCLADHILFNDFKFNAADLQIKFINWWNFSYNNCLVPRRNSFGIGNNIRISINNFIEQCNSSKIYNKIFQNNISNEEIIDILNKELSAYLNKNYTGGNGSLMRLAPVPISFASREDLYNYALDYAEKQSYVTHSGEEASEACRLLTHLIIKLINYKSEDFNKIIKISHKDENHNYN